MRGFQGYHPVILFLYFLLGLGFSMFSLHPLVILCSLAGALSLYGSLHGVRKLGEEIAFGTGLFLILTVTNPLFVHNGETILFFLNDNPVTLEAILYGAASAAAIISIMIWCSCFLTFLTTDKLLYLFGKVIPKLGLILSMAFRFIPLFERQMEKIRRAQKTMGLYAADNVPDKVRGTVRVFDSLISWSIENSIDTADAMKARGYGLPRRRTFSVFSFHRRDKILLAVMILCTVETVMAFWGGSFTFYYYPVAAELSWNPEVIIPLAVLFIFYALPGLIEWKEKILWNYLKSKI